MILYYLYLEEHNILMRVDMNFHANRRFNYDPDSKRLVEMKIKRKIPDRFFTTYKEVGERPDKLDVNSKRNIPVDAVSVIIGDNGAGKTSVADALSRIMLGRYDKPFVMVFEIEPGVIKYTSSIREICTNIPAVEYGHGAGYGMSLCYFSPHFAPYRVVRSDDDRVGDISSGNLVLKEESISAYEDEETRRLYEFIAVASKETDWLRKVFELNTPLGLAILGSKSALDTSLEWVDQKIVDEDMRKNVEWVNQKIEKDKLIGTEELRRIREVLLREYNDPIVKAFILIMSLYWQQNYSSHMNGARWQFKRQLDFCEELATPSIATGLNQKNNGFMKERWNRIVEYVRSRDGQQISRCLSCNESEDEKHKRLVSFFTAMGDVFTQGYWKLAQKHNGRGAMTTIFKSKGRGDQLNSCLGLVLAHANLGPRTRILRFGTYPAMSAGERSSLALWSRLYEWLTEHQQFKNYIIFIDEAETTLHPYLQCRLVRNIILFFEKFFALRHVHVIFATHSPNLLSDIPTGNVVFLRRSSAEEDGVESVNAQVEDSSSMPETFGSNIFDIYYKHFNLDDGPVGAFAAEKIMNLVQGEKNKSHKTRTKGQTNKDSVLVRDLIGDDFVRGYLMMRDWRSHYDNG